MKNKVIDASKFYTLGEIVREGLIPGIDTVIKASSLIKTDAFTVKVLNGSLVSRGKNGVQYQVKGSNIIKYLALKDEQKK